MGKVLIVLVLQDLQIDWQVFMALVRNWEYLDRVNSGQESLVPAWIAMGYMGQVPMVTE